MQINTFFDFCSGIGGGRLGLENCGLNCVGHSDTSRLSDTTYMQMFDTCNDKNYGNLKKLNGNDLPKYDLLIAGFPCQTFSVIGQKAGFNDDRGQIIFQLIRLLDESRPKCFILENVKGLVTHDKGQTIKTIMKEFENIDYHVSYKVFTSLEHGVPQMRQRVYFVGFDKRAGLSGKGVSFWSVPKMARTTSGWHSRTAPRSRHNPIDAETSLNHIGSEAFLLYIDLFYLAYWGSGIFIEQYHIFPFREYCA